MKLTTCFTALLATVIASVAAVPAFPGAEGFGKDAIGGRTGGSVYIVTNLNDSGAGSLRDAVTTKNRIVVFAVGGVIKLSSRLVVSPNVYIAGQTAPGQGITVYGNGWSFSGADNSITRYIRIRMGKGGDSGKDGITIANGRDMIFDHVSVSWGRDETFSISGEVERVSITDSIIAQGLETHSCGGLMETDGGVSIFRTLYISNNTRNPKVKGKNDFTNNVVYNAGGGGTYIAGDSAGRSDANIINNAFISGPSTSSKPFTRGNANFNAYVSGNYYDSDKDGTWNGSILSQNEANYSPIVFASSRYNYPGPTTLLTAQQAYEHVKKNAGASKVRDAVDIYLINTELSSLGKTGKLIANESEVGGVGTISGGTASADADKDGIPDAWERANGLNPNDASDAMKIASNGYANIENYVNSLVGTVPGAGTNPPAATTAAPPPTTTTTAVPPPSGCAALFGQCGGSGWAGATCCSSGTCKVSNEWYSQCL